MPRNRPPGCASADRFDLARLPVRLNRLASRDLANSICATSVCGLLSAVQDAVGSWPEARGAGMPIELLIPTIREPRSTLNSTTESSALMATSAWSSNKKGLRSLIFDERAHPSTTQTIAVWGALSLIGHRAVREFGIFERAWNILRRPLHSDSPFLFARPTIRNDFPSRELYRQPAAIPLPRAWPAQPRRNWPLCQLRLFSHGRKRDNDLVHRPLVKSEGRGPRPSGLCVSCASWQERGTTNRVNRPLGERRGDVLGCL